MRKNEERNSKETQKSLSKLREQKKRNSNAEWINNMKKELQGTEEGSEAKTHLKSILKKVESWKILGHDRKHGI